MTSQANGGPLFCVRTIDKVSSRHLVLNFRTAKHLPPPKMEAFNEDLITVHFLNPIPQLEADLMMPQESTPIFWSMKPLSHDGEKCYVISFRVNEEFALQKVLTSEIVKHYLICASMVETEKRVNEGQLVGQNIGHRLDLDYMNYEILKDLQVLPSRELVNTKVSVVSEGPSTKTTTESEENLYDFHFRPKSMILTCSLSTESMPDYISFNEDRVLIKLGEKVLVDAFLPIHINLKETVWYKFDEKEKLLRIVFKVVEPCR